MDYVEITVSTTTEGSMPVADAFMTCGASGTQIIDRADLPDCNTPVHEWELMDDTLYDSFPQDVQVKAWFLKEQLPFVLEQLHILLPALRDRVESDLGSLSVSSSLVHEEDWSEVWKQYYKPLRLGQKLMIKPSWEEFKGTGDEKIIEMDPGMAFGTGSHETTALCAEMIEKYYSSGTFLDIGTGSGILALCAAKLGAEKVIAVDIDEDAVRVAGENISLNGLDSVIEVMEGDLTQGLHLQAQMAAANILAPVLKRLLPSLGEHLLPDGMAVLSGILKEEEKEISDLAVSLGFSIVETAQKGDWACVVVKK